MSTNLKYFTLGINRCISCKRKVSVCSYCYYIRTYELLKRKNESIAEEFTKLFNYGFIQ